jgi:hypothetical protein
LFGSVLLISHGENDVDSVLLFSPFRASPRMHAPHPHTHIYGPSAKEGDYKKHIQIYMKWY